MITISRVRLQDILLLSNNPLYKKATIAEAPYPYYDMFRSLNSYKGLYLSCKAGELSQP